MAVISSFTATCVEKAIVAADVVMGLVSVEAARRDYLVAVSVDGILDTAGPLVSIRNEGG